MGWVVSSAPTATHSPPLDPGISHRLILPDANVVLPPHLPSHSGASLVAQSVKNQLTIQETPVMRERPRFDPWVRKCRWRRREQPTPTFLPGKSHGQRSLAGYSPWGHSESDAT